MKMVTPVPGLTWVPGLGFWFSTVPRLLHVLSVTLTVPARKSPTADRSPPACAGVSPLRSGTVTSGCGAQLPTRATRVRHAPPAAKYWFVTTAQVPVDTDGSMDTEL